jgi:predicted ATP-grasp superfamily ATP-dependent carboligase
MRLFLYEYLSAGGLGKHAPLSLLNEGAAMLAAALADFGRIPGVEVVGLVDQSLSGAWGPVCQRTSADQELEHFRRLIRQTDATLVIAPETGGILEQRSRMVEAAAGRLLGSRPDAIRLAADKVALADYWRSRSVATPLIAPVDPRRFRSLAFPVVLKPRYGAGSQATFLVNQQIDLTEALSRAQAELSGEELLFQHFVAGRAASVAFLIGPRQLLPLEPAWQHLSDDGRFKYLGGSLPLSAPWRERAVKIGEEALTAIEGLQGFAGVDLVLGEDGIDYALEINPRLTTSYLGLRLLAKVNLAETWLQLLDGELVEPIEWRDKTVCFAPTSNLLGEP